MEYLRKRLQQLEDQLQEKQAREKRFTEFSEIDAVFVSSLSDKDLAGWQAKYPTDSPQFIIANHEWQRRLNLEQIRSNRHSAYIGLLGVILGVGLTSIFTYVNSLPIKPNTPVVKPAVEQEVEKKLNNPIQSTAKAPTD
ncbi:hypothetical protein K3H46_01340 [Aeromonas veronii]|uniref:hypothetical protein n=1 Tax=Aeromonas TaxID=642 RepID=UPI001F478EA1|nr:MULTISPECIES: hypothetical protein [Aeromonas]MCF5889673.1 hypothetical protein [Aeromonas veronii]USP08477.1 hypothetical protein L1S45_14980 [Aeromonas dhakensis]